jgi:hypothetical protein
MLLTARDRLLLAQGLSVRGSTIRKLFDPVASMPPVQPPANFQTNELPRPRTGLRLVELERARQRETQRRG